MSRSLAELRAGKPFVLLFLRFASCPVTRRDLVSYGTVCDRLAMLDAGIAAVTADSPRNHLALRERLELPFPLLSDADFAVSERYGIYCSDEIDEGPQPHGEPAVFILDRDGRVVYSQVMSGPRGLADPADLVLVLLYMSRHGGRYW